MAQPYVRSLAAAATSTACPVSLGHESFNIGLAVVVTGTNTSKVQFTLDDPALATDAQGSNLAWFDHSTLVGLTASLAGSIAFPVRAVRLQVTAYTSGSAVMTVLQAGY